MVLELQVMQKRRTIKEERVERVFQRCSGGVVLLVKLCQTAYTYN